MGACNFYDQAWGKNAKEAFRNAVESSQYEYGHGGYTGTIAEKHSFVEHPSPKRIPVSKWVSWIEEVSFGKLTKIPIKHRELAKRASEDYQDKWGPAVCIPVTGKALAEEKKRRVMKGSHMKLFVFIGFASE